MSNGAEFQSIFGNTYAGVPNPQVPHVHPYPTRFHGPIWRWPVFGMPWRENTYVTPSFLGLGADATPSALPASAIPTDDKILSREINDWGPQSGWGPIAKAEYACMMEAAALLRSGSSIQDADARAKNCAQHADQALKSEKWVMLGMGAAIGATVVGIAWWLKGSK